MRSDWLAFCDYGFSVSAFWCPLATPTVLLGFLLLGLGVSLHGCSSKAQRLLLTLNEGYLLTTAPPDLECGVAPLGPPAPAQPLLRHRSLDVGWLLSSLFCCFPLFLCIDLWGRLSSLSLLFFGTPHSNEYIFAFLLCLLFPSFHSYL